MVFWTNSRFWLKSCGENTQPYGQDGGLVSEISCLRLKQSPSISLRQPTDQLVRTTWINMCVPFKQQSSSSWTKRQCETPLMVEIEAICLTYTSIKYANKSQLKHVCWRSHIFLQAQYLVCWTAAQSALHVTPWQTCSFRHQLGFSGKHSKSRSSYTRRLYSPSVPSLHNICDFNVFFTKRVQF